MRASSFKNSNFVRCHPRSHARGRPGSIARRSGASRTIAHVPPRDRAASEEPPSRPIRVTIPNAERVATVVPSMLAAALANKWRWPLVSVFLGLNQPRKQRRLQRHDRNWRSAWLALVPKLERAIPSAGTLPFNAGTGTDLDALAPNTHMCGPTAGADRRDDGAIGGLPGFIVRAVATRC